MESQPSREGQAAALARLALKNLRFKRRVAPAQQTPIVCKPHEAKVASHGIFDRMVITSPNMEYIPPYPVESMVIETYTDGLWGTHEYSRTPQRLAPGMWHIACIPKAASPPELPEVLWMSLSSRVDWKEDVSIGFSGLGFIQEDTRELLDTAAGHAIRRFEEMTCDENVRKYGQMLVMILRQVLDRMRHLPASATVSIAVAAHVQRICLELAGLKTFVEIVAPRKSSSLDYSMEVLPVVGTFVAEGSEAMNTTRVGLPTWFLQPLTADLPVWAVVETCALPSCISRQRMDPPILQHAHCLVGVGNLTGNWQESMLLTVSKHIAGTHLASLSLAEVPVVPDIEPEAKRPRLEQSHRATHLHMSAADPVVSQPGAKRSNRPRKRGKGSGAAPIVTNPQVANIAKAPAARTREPPHPSKCYVPSPFFHLPCAWENALRSVGTLPRAASSALYFYPPPFLLDTVSSVAVLPSDCPHPEHARTDEKVHQYLHNLVRIRRFLRARLFDPSLSHEPLAILEWRAALWGDYAIRSIPPAKSGSPSDFRRAQRRQGDRNGVRRLFSRVAQLRSYSAEDSVQWGEETFDLARVATDCSLRRRLLWESHEINFRAEVMALDTLLVHKPAWLEIHRWEREALVSGIWGPPTSAVTVIPPEDDRAPAFGWAGSEAHVEVSELALRTLRTFVRVLARWPDCPEPVVHAGRTDLDLVDFSGIQAQAVEFYVRTFVKHYSRLPVPPIAYIL
ncbi:hypothetical protein OH76DRAFT_1457272 [Lentinus brumalis]|uniref:Uncharacterized protein n=1 Tax=Lentinus brumalis TaxID=2498619 RepID=A0A371D156_9APHY|nr:hypothetical protein OH76DRAFT_1457272 [Polyporus brumalis]